MIEIKKPRIECIETPTDPAYGKYIVEPLERGYGTTLGNSLRRVLLSSLPGIAVTSIKIAGVQHEFSQVHLRQASRDGDELPYRWNQTSHKGRDGSVFIEKTFRLFHFLLVYQAQVSPSATSESIDDWTPQEVRKPIVYKCAYDRTDRGEHDNAHHTQFSTIRFVSGRRNHYLARKGYKRTLYRHQQGHCPIIQVIQTPLYKCYRFHNS